MFKASDPGRPGLLRRLSGRSKLIIVGVAAVGLAVIVVAALLRGGNSAPSTPQEAGRRLSKALTESWTLADRADGAVDTVKLAKVLERDLAGYIVDLDQSSDHHQVGVAARPTNGSVCTFGWTVVGGSKTARVDDPNLPCSGAVALAAAHRDSSGLLK